MAKDTGTSTTISFGTTGFTAGVVSIAINGIKVEEYDITTLADTTAQKLPGDVKDAGELEIEYLGEEGSTTLFPTVGTSETITMTFPGGDTYIGTGFIKQNSITVNREPLKGTMTIACTGTWTYTA